MMEIQNNKICKTITLSINVIILLLFMTFIIKQNVYAKSTFSADRIKQFCENYINENFQNVQSIEFLIKFSDIQFDEDNINANIEFNLNPNSSIQKLQIIFSNDNHYLKIYDIPFRVTQIQEVYIAQRDIHPNEAISENDFILSKSGTIVSPDVITNSNDLENKIAKRTIKKGEILKISSFSSPKIISRGESVQIEVVSGSVVIRTTGTSLDDAEIGNSVRVRRDGNDSKTTLTGKVNDEGIVQIILK